MAESWSVEPDHMTWTFKLRHGLRWSDGQPLTAEDVVFTWNDIMYNPQFNQVTYGLFQVGGKDFVVTNLDAVTVRVVTPEIYAPFSFSAPCLSCRNIPCNSPCNKEAFSLRTASALLPRGSSGLARFG